MSIQIPAWNTTLHGTLAAAAGRTSWKVITGFGKIPTAASLGSTNVLAELSNSQGAFLQLAVGNTGIATAKGKAVSASGNVSVAAGSAFTRDTWVFFAAAIGPDGGGNTIIKAYTSQGGSIVSNTTSAPVPSADTADWDVLAIGNDINEASQEEASAFSEWQDKAAEVAVYTAASEAACDQIITNLWNGGTVKAPNNITESPIFYAKLEDSVASTVGSNLTDDGVTIQAGDHPTVENATPTNPTITAGPTATSIGETSYNVNVTADADCTYKVVIKAGHNATQPTQTEFDNATITQSGTAATQAVIPVTGRTANTQETIWVEADGLAGGTSDYGSANVTTTPAAPSITDVNSGSPLVIGSTITITGSGFTGHTQCDIEGTVQSDFVVVNDTTVTITATLATALKLGVSGNLNIGGTTFAVTMDAPAGYGYTDAQDPIWPTKAERFDADQIWDWAVGKQVMFDVNGAMNFNIGTDGRSTADQAGVTTIQVFDGSAWGTPGSYTVSNAGINILPGLIAASDSVFTPTVTAGAITVSPPLIAAAESVFAPTVSVGALNITPSLIPASDSVFAPTVSYAAQNIEPALIGPVASVFAPTVTAQLVSDFAVCVQDFVDDISIEVPDAFHLTIARAVRFAMVEFFSESECWKQEFQVSVTKGTNEYTLSLWDNSYIYALDYAYFDRGDDNRRLLESTLAERVNKRPTGSVDEVYTTRTGVVINPAGEDGTLDVGVIIKPDSNIDCVPDDFARPYWEAIRAGALARLLAMPSKDWTDKGSADYYRAVFENGINQARRESRQDRSRPKRTIKYGGLPW